MTNSNEIESLLGKLAMKVFSTNFIGTDSSGIPCDGMRSAPECTVDVLFREVVLTVYTGAYEPTGHPVCERMETKWGAQITAKELCDMIDKVNEVADIRRKMFSEIIMSKLKGENNADSVLKQGQQGKDIVSSFD